MVRRDVKNLSVKLSDTESYSGNIPFGVLSSMIENGLCTSSDAEDGKVELPQSCTLSSVVELSESEAKRKYVYIELSGVCAKGELFFNGKSCGVLNSPYRAYMFDVTDKAICGSNKLEIKCNEPYSAKQYLDSYGERSLEYDVAERVLD